MVAPVVTSFAEKLVLLFSFSSPQFLLPSFDIAMEGVPIFIILDSDDIGDKNGWFMSCINDRAVHAFIVPTPNRIDTTAIVNTDQRNALFLL